MKNFALDSYSVLAYQKGEKGKDRVKELLLKAEEGKIKIYLNWINIGEIYYILIRETDEEIANKAIAFIKKWPLNLVVPDEINILNAAKIKSKNPISYADAFAASTAIQFNADLVTGDPEFKILENKIPIYWIV
ncbi:MAG: type II toxin-antitoxin system VapC family toxin [Acidobacteriota bacterium]